MPYEEQWSTPVTFDTMHASTAAPAIAFARTPAFLWAGEKHASLKCSGRRRKRANTTHTSSAATPAVSPHRH